MIKGEIKCKGEMICINQIQLLILNMKKIIFVILLLIITLPAYSQVYETVVIKDLAAKVSVFDTSGAVINSRMPGEFDVKNKHEDILRFKVDDKGNIAAYHCGIAYILYDFTSGWISSISTYDKNGAVKGDDEFDDIARLELEIKDMPLLHAKFEALDEADGNLKMNDSDMKIVYQKTYNSKGKLLKEAYINTPEYWNMTQLLYRP